MEEEMSEAILQEQVANYLVAQYPDVMFHSDFGSGAKLTPTQAAKQKRQNGGRSGWPDMFIAEPQEWCFLNTIDPQNIDRLPRGFTNPYYGPPPHFCDFTGSCSYRASGLFLELKKDGEKLIRDKDAKKILKGESKLRKKGDWWDDHIEEQAKVLEGLRQRGYCAEFAVGFNEAKRIIDEYLGGNSE